MKKILSFFLATLLLGNVAFAAGPSPVNYWKKIGNVVQLINPAWSLEVGDLTVTGTLTAPGLGSYGDDVPVEFGDIPDSELVFSTLSAGANVLRWSLPDASVDNIPWLVLGTDNVLTADFTSSAGITEPGLGIMDASATKDLNFFYNSGKFNISSSTSEILLDSTQGIDLKVSSANGNITGTAYSVDAANYLGADFQFDASSTGAGSYTSSGLNATTTWTGTNLTLGGIQGGLITATHNGTNSVQTVQGLAVAANFLNTGTANTAVGIAVSNGKSSTGAPTTMYGIKLNAPNGSDNYAFDIRGNYLTTNSIKTWNGSGTKYILTSSQDNEVAITGSKLTLRTDTGDIDFRNASGFYRFYGSSGARNTYFYNDNTNGWVGTSVGDLKISAFGNNILTKNTYVEGTTGLFFGDLKRAVFGTGSDFAMLWNTYQTNNAMHLGVDAISRTILIADLADSNTNFLLPAHNDPALIIMGNDAATPDRYGLLKYDNASDTFLIQTGQTGEAKALKLKGSQVTANTNNFNAQGIGTYTYVNLLDSTGAGVYTSLDWNGIGTHTYGIENNNTIWMFAQEGASGAIYLGGVGLTGSDTANDSVMKINYNAANTGESVIVRNNISVNADNATAYSSINISNNSNGDGVFFGRDYNGIGNADLAVENNNTIWSYYEDGTVSSGKIGFGNVTIGAGSTVDSAVLTIDYTAGAENTSIFGGISQAASPLSGTPNGLGKYLSLNSGTFTDNNTAASGTATEFSFNSFNGGTLAATNTNVTTQIASSLKVNDFPTAGTNQTIGVASAFSIGSLTGFNSGANEALSQTIIMPGINSGVGNVDTRRGLFITALGNVSLGDQTANISNLETVAIEQIPYESTTNTRTVTGKVASLFIAGAPTAGTNVIFSNQAYAILVNNDDVRIEDNLSMGGNVIFSVENNIVASITQSQGQAPLTKDINEVVTVANANDVVTMPAAQAGKCTKIINNGVSTLQIFPASGDDLGAGVDTSITLTSGSNASYCAYDATNWEQF